MKNLGLIVAALFGLVLCVSVLGQTDPCDNRPEGWIAEIGCWGYYKCVNATLEKFPCEAGKVLERDTLTCVEPGTGSTACGDEAICSGRSDGSYADVAKGCQSYFVCLGEKNMGRLYCPANLVWNESLGLCDWKFNVAEPCGDKKEE